MVNPHDPVAPAPPSDLLSGPAAQGFNAVDPLGQPLVAPPMPLPPDPAMQTHEPTADIPAELGNVDRPVQESPLDLERFVQNWWTRTSNTPEWDRMCRQHRKDTAALLGMEAGAMELDDQKLNDDRSEVTTPHIYRNAIMSVALAMPTMPDIAIEPSEDVPAYVDGTAVPIPGQMDDVDGISAESEQFACALDLLTKKMLKKCDAVDALRDWIQDAFHYQIAWLEYGFQSQYDTDLTIEGRLPDSQDNIALARTMLEQYARGEFLRTDGRYREMQDLVNAIGAKTEVDQARGIVLNVHAPNMVRVSGNVKRPSQWHRADWIALDLLMTRDQVLAKWRVIKPADLERAMVYDISGRQLSQIKQDAGEAQVKPTGEMMNMTSTKQATMNEWDLLLVRQIHSRQHNRVIVLVQGLNYPAVNTPIKTASEKWYQLRPFVLNPPPSGTGRVVGISNTQMQAKLQDELNRIRTDRARAVRAAEPRFIYDKDLIQDDIGKALSKLGPHEGLGVSFGGKAFNDVFQLVVGSNQLNEELYTDMPVRQDMRSTAGIPESLTGSVGTSNFASENNTAEAGANILSQFHRNRMSEALEDAIKGIVELLVQNVTVEEAVALLGENVRQVWMDAPQDRWSIYNRLKVTVKAGFATDGHKKNTLEGIKMVQEAALENQEPIDTQELLELICRVAGIPADMDKLLKLDPSKLAMKLIQALQKNPNIDPQIALALEQVIGPLAQQAVAQMAVQQAGGPQPAPGGGPGQPGGGPPGLPPDDQGGMEPTDTGPLPGPGARAVPVG